jgi:hypothetical protein
MIIKDKIAVVISVLAFLLSMATFAVEKVSLSAMATAVDIDLQGNLEFEVAFANSGNVEILIGEVEISSIRMSDNGSYNCKNPRDRLIMKSEVRPISSGWFSVSPGEFEVTSFKFEDLRPTVGLRAYCFRIEVNDVDGNKYNRVARIIEVDFKKIEGKLKADSEFVEKVVIVANGWSFFRSFR